MPKSKNTRKKAYRPRQVKIGPYWPADQQADEKLRRKQNEKCRNK